MNYLNKKYILFESNIDDIKKICNIYNIKKYNIEDDGSIVAFNNVYFNDIDIKKIPLKFKEVFGDFSIEKTHVDSLFGSPKYIHGNYNISYTKIKNLKHCPIEVGGNFLSGHCENLVEFCDFPKHIENICSFYKCNLKTLYKCINHLNNIFIISFNSNLYTLKYGPKHVEYHYYCSFCNLKTLQGAPKYVGGDFNCYGNNIKSLKYSPQYIGGDFIFSYNKILTFDHFPNYVGGDVKCYNNPIYNIWVLFKNKEYIEYFNQMKILKNNIINIKKMNTFLKSIEKNTIKNVEGYIDV